MYPFVHRSIKMDMETYDIIHCFWNLSLESSQDLSNPVQSIESVQHGFILDRGLHTAHSDLKLFGRVKFRFMSFYDV